MKKYIYYALLLCLACACGADHKEEGHGHEEEGHSSVQLSSISGNIELFAESEELEEGEETSLTAWFTDLDNFKAAAGGNATLSYRAEGGKILSTEGEKLREGVFRFDFTPGSHEDCLVSINFAGRDFDCSGASHSHAPANSVNFSREQSWKVDFATAKAEPMNLGSVIKTVGRISALPEREFTIVAKTSGIIRYAKSSLTVGSRVSKGDPLFFINSSGLADSNMEVRYSNAKAEYERASEEYERKSRLAESSIVSKGELSRARAEYLSAKAEYENLERNYRNGSFAAFPENSGYVDGIYVSNGDYVETGTPLACVAGGGRFLVTAKVQPSYFSELQDISECIFLTSKGSYSLSELDGKIISVGRSASAESPLIPVNIEINGYEGCLSGSFADLRICCSNETSRIAVPNEALVEESGNFFVYKQLNPETYEKVQVVPAESNGRYTAIVSGLQGGETIVSRGAVILKLVQAAGSLDAHSGHVH